MPPPTNEPVRLLAPTTLRPTGRRLPGFPRTPARATHLAYSRDGNTLVAMIQYYGDGVANDFSSGGVFVWDVRPGRPPTLRRTMPLSAESVQDVAVSPTGDRIYTTKPVAAYDVASGKQLFIRPELAFGASDLSPDGKTLALGSEATDTAGPDYDDALLLDAVTGRTQQKLSRHTNNLLGVKFSHDGKLLVSRGADLGLVVWDVAAGSALEDIPISEGDTLTAAFSPDDKTLYTSAGDGALRSWDLTGNRRYVTRVKNSTGFELSCRIIAPGGKVVYRLVETSLDPVDAGGQGGTFVNSATGKAVRFDATHMGDSTNSCGTWHPSGNRFAFGNTDGEVFVLDVRSGRLLAKRKVSATPVLDLDYSGLDGSRLVIGTEGGAALLLDAETLQPLRQPVQIGASLAWLSASPDNRSAFVLTGGRNISDRLDVPSTGWAMVDLAAGTVLRRGKLPVIDPELVAFAPNGKRVAIGSAAGHVLIVDPATGRTAAPPQLVHQGLTNGLAFSADSSLLVSSGWDGSVSLFDGATAALLGSIVTPNQQLVTADFLADGHTVMIAAYDDGIYRWDTRLEHAIETACRMAGRDLTEAEWRDNFGNRPYRRTC
ncbi:WD40 repeat domain-containing protein [Kribbella sp. NPDC051952]|uniref:WD40 repeat domain-containing protein n=1 Tax=Kribbella sp. NPDC051952 TaxID=3154851 RepID=UPI00343125F1